METVVITPTYNERLNVETFATHVLQAVPSCALLFVDDASPDGTGALLDQMAAREPRLAVLHRSQKAGLGPAYLAGFAAALTSARYQDAQFFCEMDADLSHPPARLPALIAACRDGADLAIGSRWIAGGGTARWSRRRQWLSRAGSFYARALLGVPLRDLTAGFVCYRRAALARLVEDEIVSNGYCFQIELKARAARLGMQMVELPILFAERQAGASKMTAGIAAEAITKVWRLRRLLQRGTP